MSAAPRHEFRAFAACFGLPMDRLRRAAECQSIKERREQYIIAAGVERMNVKLRDGHLETKLLLDEMSGDLEFWKPGPSHALPVSRRFLQEVVFPVNGMPRPEFRLEQYSVEQLRDAVHATPGLIWARVFKRRFQFQVDECQVEYADVRINGAALQTMAVEAERPQSVHDVISRLRLGEYENVNYPRAIRRVTGLEPWPEDAAFG